MTIGCDGLGARPPEVGEEDRGIIDIGVLFGKDLMVSNQFGRPGRGVLVQGGVFIDAPERVLFRVSHKSLI